MTTLPLPPESRQPRQKPISVSDREAQKAERDELLRVAAILMAGRLASSNVPDADEMVDLAQMLIVAVNMRFEVAE